MSADAGIYNSLTHALPDHLKRRSTISMIQSISVETLWTYCKAEEADMSTELGIVITWTPYYHMSRRETFNRTPVGRAASPTNRPRNGSAFSSQSVCFAFSFASNLGGSFLSTDEPVWNMQARWTSGRQKLRIWRSPQAEAERWKYEIWAPESDVPANEPKLTNTSFLT